MNKHSSQKDFFTRFAEQAACILGGSWSFIFALFVVLGWLLLGPIFHYSDTWQLVMNTLTSIITFLMVFLIQNTQNRNTSIINLKLDELIKATSKAHNNTIDLSNLSDKDLKILEEKYNELCKDD